MSTNSKWIKLCVLVALFGGVGTEGAASRDYLPSVQSVQQSNKVTGLVSDESGPVAGASIAIKGTSNGTISDANGRFVLENLKRGSVLIISFVGYTSQQITCITIWVVRIFRVQLTTEVLQSQPTSSYPTERCLQATPIVSGR